MEDGARGTKAVSPGIILIKQHTPERALRRCLLPVEPTQRFIDGLTQKLAYTRLELVALRASPPAIDVEILEIHVQAADTTHSMHASDLPVACDIFLRVKLTLRDTRPIGLLAYELASVLHGNSSRADFVDDIQDWGLVTEKKPIGVGTTDRKSTRLNSSHLGIS